MSNTEAASEKGGSLMCKVILVEDMDLIRRDIREMIDWNRYGFELVGEARNGEQGLELYQKTHPDIVITDIKMPLLNGLEMIRSILALNPETQFILLTAYEEFDYAKQAIQFGIHSYLLKHELEENILLTELEKLRNQIRYHKKATALNNEESICSYLLAAPQQSVLLPPLFSSWKEPHACVLAHFSETPLKEELLSLSSQLPSFSFDSCRLSERLYVFFLLLPTNSSQAQETLLVFSQELLEQLSCLSSVSGNIALAVVSPQTRQESMRAMFQKSQQLLHFQVFFPENCILESSLFHPVFSSFKNFAQKQLERLCLDLEQQNFSSARRKIPEFESTLSKLRDLAFYEQSIRRITDILIHMQNPTLPLPMIHKLSLLSGTAVSQKVCQVCHLLSDILECIQNTLLPTYSKKVEDVIRFVKKHYAEDITLQMLADELNISPLYISQLFKKEVGVNLTNYITKYRISIAASLLQSGNYKIYEVSEMVGYQTVQYFSNSFKKETGKTPSEYGRYYPEKDSQERQGS